MLRLMLTLTMGTKMTMMIVTTMPLLRADDGAEGEEDEEEMIVVLDESECHAVSAPKSLPLNPRGHKSREPLIILMRWSPNPTAHLS